MECVEKALKSSVVRPELAFKLTQQPVFMDDFCIGNGQSGVSGEEFSIDDLLDFTNEGIGEGLLQEEDEEEDEKGGCDSNLTTAFSLKDEFPSVPVTAELTVPVWLLFLHEKNRLFERVFALCLRKGTIFTGG